ncbi:ferrous iron transporter B [Candidatus Epulonipiscium fishelsonii]|uniref:Ferrous iron transporter B n=1 Tax=Candidatus Epulonipiscium fishelsonii TaxID=77094 RepID=A0ACC8XG75_9FIRM|nr:ferrous iron transporter B [Epulopiscium sp. SCG-B05WGA-EpuloA1]ONI42549.1 ferrous iron transporter B [Epulopiscium sp. SCG-B11WGA-EpuloA1]ONI47183.1 ferrous iron transporter B [Epulopiscium sp. SCG-C06WGA-EpuloA1]
MKIALAGNPNSGKTSLFNTLTGEKAYVGNWAGVTVSKKEAYLKDEYAKGEKIVIVDLPGAYSMSPYTSEESITRDYVNNENPDVIINVVDSTNLNRSLFFTSQLLELGIPMVIALNKHDLSDKKEITIDTLGLSEKLECKVVTISALKFEGIETLIQFAKKASRDNLVPNPIDMNLIITEGDKQTYKENDIKRFNLAKQISNTYEKRTIDTTLKTRSDKIDEIVANKVWGLPIFAVIMWAVYWFSQRGLGGYLSEYLNEVFFGDIVPTTAINILESMNVSGFLQALIVDGIIGGVGAVLGFLPLIMVLFFCLSLLEDCGYMARVAVIMNRYFKKIGLSGKSIIPMLVGSGCAIPGIMSTRTIENTTARRATAILTPFVPCGAKLPIIGLFAMVFFPTSAWVAPLTYFIAILVIITSGLIIKHMFNIDNSESLFIIELPEYKWPSLKIATLSMLDKAKAFIIKAGTIILLCNASVWLLQSYDFSLHIVENADFSMLAYLGGIISPLFIPLGMVGWQLAAASITGFIAKENVVGSLAVMFAISEEMLHSGISPLLIVFTPVTAFAFMCFNLFTPPCFAAIGAMNSELASRKVLAFGVGFQVMVGYTVAMLINQIGTFVTTGNVADGFVASIIILIVEVAVFIKVSHNSRKSAKQSMLATA